MGVLKDTIEIWSIYNWALLKQLTKKYSSEGVFIVSSRNTIQFFNCFKDL